ncbi:MAG TPA: TIGR03960 family B12-binding radical SAM protein [Geobacterales bacterium]|nr:TIGR03960 family B12-binding radical SAM protein [Geobacterales bacterium]
MAFSVGGIVEHQSLLSIEKPVRYLGDEIGAIHKPEAEIRFALAFPDVYDVAMSHLGSQILYTILNTPEWLAAERVHAPWPDREAQLRQSGEPLTTLESGTPLHQVEIIGFTLQYELAASNILAMLDLGGIPLLAAERGDSAPLVIGGGPGALNPEPLADFFDAFFLGDGEEGALEIAATVRQAKRDRISRRELLQRLAAIDGVYIPSLYRVSYLPSGEVAEISAEAPAPPRVRRRIIADLNRATVPTSPVLPLLKTVHDRVSAEIARGCTRGCRFCQAGYTYRPLRERDPLQLLDDIDTTLRGTGYEEISLLSLSSGDYSCITPLIRTLMSRYADDKVAVSLPSLRVGSLTRELAEEVKRVRKTGFTLAPEAGSERLRQVINKGITEEDLLATATEVYTLGWRLIKLYFMIGLPTESDDDLQALIDLASRVKKVARQVGGGGDVSVSASTFVPKPHTPFQWEGQISLEETRRRQDLLRHALRDRKLKFKWHDPHLSALEGVIARGDRRLGPVILAAYRLGCRFDGWGDHFRADLWQEAFHSSNVDPLFYHRPRRLDEVLPWEHLDAGVTKEFLLNERQRAVTGESTPDCRNGLCSGCGVCDFSTIVTRLSNDGSLSNLPPVPPLLPSGTETSRIRVHFSKTGSMALISHLELISLFTRAVRRGGIPVRHSQGFHPHPKFSFATALSVGIESEAEYMDLEVAGGFPASEVQQRLNAVLPAGMRIVEAQEIPLKAPSLSVIISAARYRVTLPPSLAQELPAQVRDFLSQESSVIVREKKGKRRELDLRAGIVSLAVDGASLEMVINRGKPIEVTAAVTGHPISELQECTIEKVAVIFTP